MPEIKPADINAVNRLKESRASCSSEADVTTLLQVAFAAHREAAVAAYIATTTPPEPRALTAEIVKEMLPANQEASFLGLPRWALYKSPIGSILWEIRASGNLVLMINSISVPLTAIGTDRKLAALVAAFGIGVGVKHG